MIEFYDAKNIFFIKKSNIKYSKLSKIYALNESKNFDEFRNKCRNRNK